MRVGGGGGDMTEQEWRDRFGAKLAAIINARGCTCREFAEEFGISEKTLNHYICGRRVPKIATLVNLAKTLGYSVDKFVDFGEKIEK